MSKSADNFEFLTEEDLATLRQHAAGETTLGQALKQTPTSRTSFGLSPDRCRQFRQWAADGASPYEINERDDIDAARTTIRRHVRGRCHHDDETVGYPPIPAGRHGITAGECRRFRELGADGVLATDIAARDDIPWSAEAICVHRRGACGHDDAEIGHPPVDGRDVRDIVTPAHCACFREWAANDNPSRVIAQRASIEVGVSTVRRHVRGDCVHDDQDVAHPPVTDWDPQRTVTATQCRRFREWAADGASAKSIAARNTVPCGRWAVQTHIRGDCYHDEYEVGHPSLTYDRSADQWGVDD